MSDPRGEVVRRLLASASPQEQAALRKRLGGEADYGAIRHVYLNNPFFKLLDEEVSYFASRNAPDPLDQLMLARDAASKSTAPKVAVFCMPKSGSSFVQSAIQAALRLPVVSLTSVAGPQGSSNFGMNSREQELDELAIVRAILAAPQGFVAQVHTRCSLYLARQLRFYGVSPILTVRNILDCIVSYDDMMVGWRRGRSGHIGWLGDPQFALPESYLEMDEQARYRLLARSFGVWLVGFYLSWRRCIRQKFVDPVVLRYETDILQPEALVRKMARMTRMDDDELERLRQYAASPDPARSRFNVGQKGRGARIDDATVEDLLDYARQFGDELTAEEIGYLIR